MTNTFALMLVMIGLGLFGKPEIAADFGIIHGATVALFYSFSGNARSLILGNSGIINARGILGVRGLLLIPLCVSAYFLSVTMVGIDALLAIILIGRRGCEWIAEVFLSVHEVRQNLTRTLGFFLTQTVVSLLLILVFVQDFFLKNTLFLIWAISPLCWCITIRMLRDIFSMSKTRLLHNLNALLPHFGSTAVIGVSVYVFRLYIYLLTDKETAGDLFSAFAIGGILGAMFAQAIGPTIVHFESTGNFGKTSRPLKAACMIAGIAGIVLVLYTLANPDGLAWTQKGILFWQAVGYSLIGSVIMVRAHLVRLRILQSYPGRDVFGSDMLANILLVVSIPFLYSAFGIGSFVALYMGAAVLSLFFYISECRGADSVPVRKWWLFLLVFGLFFPLFFKLTGGIHHVPADSGFDTMGQLDLLPLPLSMAVCYLGILLLGGYNKARLSLFVIFTIFIGMVFSTALFGQAYNDNAHPKLVLFAQFILPLFALVLGQQYQIQGEGLNVLGKVFLGVLLIVVPLQLIASFKYGLAVLSPSAILFSVYQHLQYVPVVFVIGFLVCIFSLWRFSSYRIYIFILAAMLGFYVSLSMAILAIALFVFSLIIFTWVMLKRREGGMESLAVALCGLAMLAVGLAFFADSSLLDAKLYRGVNLAERIGYWRFYLDGLTEGWISALFGHAVAPDRAIIPSAHNYYLDFAYNFGLIAVGPLLYLVFFTLYMLLRHREVVRKRLELLGLTAGVLFLILVDSQLKVGMRQPYPGIFTFFLWGVLLTILTGFNKARKMEPLDSKTTVTTNLS